MNLNKDYKEFLELLNGNKVDYLVVGGYSVAFHGYPRYTGDIDIWINPTKENTIKIIATLDSFGFGSLGLSQENFLKNDQVIQLGQEPLRIDIMTAINGVPSFDEAFKKRKVIHIANLMIPYIGLDDLLTNKKNTGRARDKDDIENLKKIKNRK